ncbi:MAG: hypothetical protein WAN74_00700 [Thermoplasmata archaeon]
MNRVVVGAVLAALLLCMITPTLAPGVAAGEPPRGGLVSVPGPQDVSSIAVWTSLGTGTTNLSGGAFLYVPPNSTGVLVYPIWHVDMTTSVATSYVIYAAGLEIDNGSFAGTRHVAFNVTGPTATVLIGFAGTTYQYRDENVASVSVSQYYGGTPSPLVYTAQAFEQALTTVQAQEYAVLLLAFLGSWFMARKIVILNAKARATRVL